MEDILEMLIIFTLIAIPVFGLTARFALKPLLEVLIELRRSAPPPPQSLQAQVQDLTAEVEHLRRSVARLEESNAFALELQSPARPGGAEPRLPHA